MAVQKNVIANQVFIGCPWKTIKPKYEKQIESLKKKYPLSFILIGNESAHTAEDLLAFIKTRLEKSSGAIFDVTAGNPNVSLEFGYAEGRNVPSTLHLGTHGKTKSRTSTIISDLAGKRRREYKNETSLSRLMADFSKNHPYTLKFEKGMKALMKPYTKGEKKSIRALCLKIVHFLDGEESVRRDNLLLEISAMNPLYSEDIVDEWIRNLHAKKLIRVSKGRYANVEIA